MDTLVTLFTTSDYLIDRAGLLASLDAIASKEPELSHDIPNIFRREGIRFEFVALVNYLFIVASEPISETEHLVIIVRAREAEEKIAALGALKRYFGEPDVREINCHDAFSQSADGS
jgi:hypothetical protein